MKPIEFDGCNQTIAKDQPEYRAMPCLSLNDEEGTRIFCWKLTWKERIKIFLTGELWQFLMTFNQPQHPQFMTVDKPEVVFTEDTPL